MAKPARRTARARGERAPSRAPRGGAARLSQRERIINAMVDLASQQGYQSLSVAQLTSHAGVSSATFYEQFSDREDCLLATYQRILGDLLRWMQRAIGDASWSDASRAALGGLLKGVQSDPDAARVVFIEAVGGGPRLSEAISDALGAFEQRAERLLDSIPPGTTTLDAPAEALVGGVRNILGRYLRAHGEDRLPGLADDMLTWMGSYQVEAGAGRWSTSPAALVPDGQGPGGSPATLQPPAQSTLPRGRHGLAPAVVARSQRTRIIAAVAEVTMEKGYANTTVADIVAAAGVAKEAFYKHFRDKQEAFLDAQQFPTQFILETCVTAYFSAPQWPERVWRAIGTLLELIAANPALAHLRMVECNAAGPEAIRRAEEITRSFTMFLEEGYSYGTVPVPRLGSDAIAGAIFEVIRREVAAGRTRGIASRRAILTYLAVAPFTGPEEAVRILEGLRSS